MKSRTNSTFANMWSKVCQLFPYVWPKGTHHVNSHALNCFLSGHHLLQLRVLFCFLILVGGRVINVNVPIYYKKIINALTPHSIPGGNQTHLLDKAIGLSVHSSGVTFPLASVLIYVFLRFLQVLASPPPRVLPANCFLSSGRISWKLWFFQQPAQFCVDPSSAVHQSFTAG